ncbi:MAG: DUF6444 domain-containing protein, partial [Acidobacteriota bacterium]
MQVIPRSEIRRLEAEAALGRRLAEEFSGVRAELKAAYTTIATLKGEITRLVTLGDNLQKQMAELNARLGTNSGNSSKPPSSDAPSAPKRPGGRGSGRGRGGHPGHKGAHRALVAAEDVDEAYSLWPDACSACEAALVGNDPDPLERQVVEIPDPRVIVTTYLLHALTCPKCEKVTRAELPEGVGNSGFGPRTHAFVATLVGRFRQSKRLVVELLDLVWGLKVSTGAVSKMEKRVAAMPGPPVDELIAHLQTSTSAHGDETSWLERLKRSWL